MNLIALPAFTDNYIWMLHDGANAIVVDPGEAAPVLQALSSRSLRLAGILVTHHHGDHVGGLATLRDHLRGPVFGPGAEHIPGPYTACRGGDTVQALGLDFQVLDVPGHTAGHIAYYLPGAAGAAPVLFCGDTLFSGGCGRLFEGTPAQMYHSLSQLARLPGATRVCCAHEYTLSNLRFATAVEPDNAALADYQRWCETQRALHQPTLPSLLSRELAINPFLRCAEPVVIRAASAHGAADADPVSVFASLRQWKNEFR
ncbi:MAG: hydroxyacylglutathione hydrolase [Burkholderiaceae bacterium]|nr:hydroxyacylglutathione hydrolase [Burkholderiaceae bacterium]